MPKSKKRAHAGDVDDEQDKTCPFQVVNVDSGGEKEKKSAKRRRQASEEEEHSRIFTQLPPFSPSGEFQSFKSLDRQYRVVPSKPWSDMTRYNSFVCE
jgi:hypothetical protein